LLYPHSDLAMWILVPRGATTPGELLDPKVLAAVGNHLSEQEIDLSLPRWTSAPPIPLMPELRKIGLTDLSNFRGISDSGLSLSDAIYRATSPLTSRAPRPVR
jgi:serine protease inhibitor